MKFYEVWRNDDGWEPERIGCYRKLSKARSVMNFVAREEQKKRNLHYGKYKDWYGEESELYADLYNRGETISVADLMKDGTYGPFSEENYVEFYILEQELK